MSSILKNYTIWGREGLLEGTITELEQKHTGRIKIKERNTSLQTGWNKPIFMDRRNIYIEYGKV